MLVTGDVKCLHCGYVSGKWVGESGAPLSEPGFTPAATRGCPTDPNAPVHCLRCGGPVFLDEATLVTSSYRIRKIRRLRRQIASLESDHPRRAA